MDHGIDRPPRQDGRFPQQHPDHDHQCPGLGHGARSIGFGARAARTAREDAVDFRPVPQPPRMQSCRSAICLRIVPRLVARTILQLEAPAADRNVHITLDDEARKWLTERGFWASSYGARPMGRLLQEKIKQPLAEELLFGKLFSGGEVKVRIKDNAPAFEMNSGAAQGAQGEGRSPRPRRRRSSPTPDRRWRMVTCIWSSGRLRRPAISLYAGPNEI